jgi:hypothetical protein
MPTPRRPDPEPLETNDVAIVTVGTVLWAIALVASLVLHDRLADSGNEAWTWVFLAGTFLGLIGIRYVRRRRVALRRGLSKFDVIGRESQG